MCLCQAAVGVSAEGYAEHASKVRHWFPCIKKLPCKSKESIYEQDVYGKKWVPIFDKAGAR